MLHLACLDTLRLRVCSSFLLLPPFSIFLSFPLYAYLSILHTPSLSVSRSLDENKRSNRASSKRGGEEQIRRRRRRKRRNESRDKEGPSVAGGTRTEARDRREERRRRRKREDTAKEKGGAAQGATKVAVTLRKASKLNLRDQKGKDERRAALRGDIEGNGRVHEEEEEEEKIARRGGRGEDARDVR